MLRPCVLHWYSNPCGSTTWITPLTSVRPLIQARESQLRAFAEENNLQVIGDEACPAMLKDVKMPHARASTKEWLAGLEKENKDIFKMFKASFKHIHDDTFLDPERWNRDDIDKEG